MILRASSFSFLSIQNNWNCHKSVKSKAFPILWAKTCWCYRSLQIIFCPSLSHKLFFFFYVWQEIHLLGESLPGSCMRTGMRMLAEPPLCCNTLLGCVLLDSALWPYLYIRHHCADLPRIVIIHLIRISYFTSLTNFHHLLKLPQK